MGMYTEFHFNVELDEDVPGDVVYILEYMVDELSILPKPPILPDHPLFATTDQRWEKMLTSDSYIFAAATRSICYYDETVKCFYLCIRCNLKNYDQDIEKFLDWIKPYLSRQNSNFLGFYRYEEEECPTLIYMQSPTVLAKGSSLSYGNGD